MSILIFLESTTAAAAEGSTRFYDINNNPSIVTNCFDFILSLMGDFVKVLKHIYIYDSGTPIGKVSIFDFCIVTAVIAIVITYLVNVARRPQVERLSVKNRRVDNRDKK